MPLPKLILLVLFGTSVLTISGCDLFRSPLPDSARITLESSELEEATLVISLNFLAERAATEQEGIIVGSNTVILPISVDTLTVTFPFDRKYDISRHRRFYAELILPEDFEDPGLQMRGWIDGDEKFSASADSQSEGSIRFIYFFRGGEGIVVRPQP